MKKYTFLSILFVISYIASSQVNDTFLSQISDYTITSKNQYTLVESKENSDYTAVIGAPKLPVFSKSYVLPPGSIVTNVTSSNGSKILLGNTFSVYPTQPPCIIGKPCPDFIVPDASVYNSTAAFPAATTTLLSDVTTFGYHVVTVNVCPFEYIPKDKKLYLYNQINFSIQYSIGQVSYSLKISEQRDKLSKDFVKGLVQNPEMITPSSRIANETVNNSTTSDKLIIPWKPSPYGKFPDYVVITSEALKEAFQPFVDYKIQRGIPTVLVTVEDIYKNYKGCDNAEKVRTYLKAARYYWGFTLSVLLGGDTAIVPGRMGVMMDLGNGVIEWNYTDMYFCDVYKPVDNYNLESDNYNWNSDGDSDFAWDEPYSSIELGPDNIIGRAPVDTVEEAENFINKIIAYENPPINLDTTYFNNMLFLGAYQKYTVLPDPNPNPNIYFNYPNGQRWHYKLSIEPFLNSPSNSSLKKWLVFDEPSGTVYSNNPNNTANYYLGNQELNRNNTLLNLKNGQSGIGKFHLISHFDHGSPYGIGVSGMTHESIFNSDMDDLREDPYYKIMYSTACEDGTFQKDCFAEHFVNATNGGGVAMNANSGSVYADGYNQDKILFQSIYGNFSTKSHILGNAFANARGAVVYYNSDNNHLKHLTLFGDPTMATWSATPQTIALNVPNSVTIDNASANILPVTINALENEATVTLYKYNSVTNNVEVYASQTIPVGGTSVQFTINPDTQGLMQVKVTSKNYLPASAEVNILMPQAHLYVTGYSINDNAPNGNGNGIIEQGETITMAIQLTNSGGTNITGINAILSCLPVFATISNNQASTIQINAGQIATLNGFSFVAQVEQAGTPLPNFMEFSVNITAAGNYVHLDNFYVELKNPKLVLGARNVISDAVDTSVKNLNVFLSNIGDVATGVLTATLTSPMADNGIIQITNPIRTYPNIEALTEQKNNEAFVFKFLQPHTGSQPFILNLYNSLNNRTWSFSFDLNEGMPDLITGFRYTSTKDQIALKWDPMTTMGGYNVYRSDTEIGGYTKINSFLITGSSIYTDIIQDDRTTFYYKISAVTVSGNERPLESVVTTGANPNHQGYKAWTSLEYNGGFPRGANTQQVCFVNSSPTLFDVDNDGKKEIFTNNYNGSDDKGIIMGFYESAQEMYNIDGNESTVSGFATTNMNLLPNSAIGDLDNDGHAEVLSIGRNTNPTLNPTVAAGPDRGKLFVYKTTDADGDNKPDKFWNDEAIDFGWKVNRNPVLYDVDGNGFLDIIVTDEKQSVYVYDKNKNLLPGWPQHIVATDWSEGSIAVADLDHDGKGEIALGVMAGIGSKGAIYIWNYDGTPFTSNPFHEFAENERADSGIVFADIDGDLNLDILTAAKQGTNSKIYAFKLDGSPLGSLWNGSTNVEVLNGQYQDAYMPKIAVGDLNHDGNLEVVFTSKDKLFVLDKDGNSFSSNFPKNIDSNINDNTPILADIDTDPDIEIVLNTNGNLTAYNTDATLCDRFPLVSEDESRFMGSPSISDINNDGKNEIVTATRSAFTYVYKTEGDSNKIEWASNRANPYNTGAYKEVCNNELDLAIKDSPADKGIEPNTLSQYMWGSSDIWVRNNNNDNNLEHQNPKYRASNSPNHIKVRVTNKSCVESTGAQSLTVYWAKASSGLGWPNPWHGGVTYPSTGASMGHEVGTLQIPPMHKGEEIILSFPWVVPNPADYGGNGDQWHFCLLAQINGGESDPLAFPLLENQLNENVRNNNNLAWKNVTVVNAPVGEIEPGGVIAVANPFEIPKTFYLEMAIADLETGKPIYDEAEVKIKMDEVLYRAWERGGKEAQLIDPTTDEKRKIVKGNHMILDNIAYLPNEIGTLKLTFNFLTKELTQKSNYVYHVMQKDVQTGQIIGGETFIINKNARTPFEADAGPDKEVDLNQAITISAADINEPAIYNWYDDDGNLVFQGKDLQIASAVAKKYKLEVISTTDGFKDYSEVEVKLKPNRLNSIAPNPATDHVNVYYKLNEASSAYLMIVSYYMNGGVSNNYVLDINSSEANINLNSYPNGFYKVILVANGNVVDAKLLFKQ